MGFIFIINGNDKIVVVIDAVYWCDSEWRKTVLTSVTGV